MIVRLKGGLGNQMFQYVFVRYLEIIEGLKNVKMDESYYTRAAEKTNTEFNSITDFNVKYVKASPEEVSNVCMFRHDQRPMSLRYRIPIALEMIFNKKRYYHVRNFLYVDPKTLLKYEYLDGSWQCPKYIEPIEETIRKEFTYKKELSANMIQQIKKASSENSVFIGIRRGDYVDERKLYGEFSDSYYNRAIHLIEKMVENPVFYVLSNDIEWVKKEVHFEAKVIYREGHDVGTAQEEMVFMSSCKHAIIPNSTFHWWGAWLIQNKNKIVIAPKEWFADGTPIDIVPKEWIKIER